MKKVAIFISDYGFKYNIAVLNIFNLLKDRFKVDLYLKNTQKSDIDFANKFYKNKNFKIIRFFNKKNIIGQLLNKFSKLKAKSSSYDCFITIDPHGFVLCKSLFPDSKPYYYSMELYVQENYTSRNYFSSIKNKERSEINSISGLIIQSEEREQLFRKDYNLSGSIPTMLLPICYTTDPDASKNNFLREKYNINSSKKIAIHLGTITDWTGAKEIIKAFSTLKDWLVFFQGNKDPKYFSEVLDMIKSEKIDNVIISDEFYDDMSQTSKLLQSCDIGIAWYKNLSPNFTTAGKSSCKIPSYLMHALPIITNDYESSINAIEKTGCGKCIKDFNELESAISSIYENYESYSTNAINEYKKTYFFRNYEKKLISFLGL